MNALVEEDIRQAIALIKEKSNSPRDLFVEYKKYGQIFCFSNEDMAGYYDQLNLRDKKVLTVAGSGDQAVNAVLYGAKEVHCFDLNRLSGYKPNLQSAAIQNIGLKQLQSFYPLECNNDYLQDRIFYERIVRFLEDNNTLFWDRLFTIFNREKLKFLFAGVRRDLWSFDWLKEYNPYMNESKYAELQSKLKGHHFPFIESCITKLPENLKDNKYDLMLLSDIYIDIVDQKSLDQLMRFKQLILRLSNNLNPGGEIAYAYARNYQRGNDWLKENGYSSNLTEIFNDNERRVIHIDRGNGEHNTAVLLYRKAA